MHTLAEEKLLNEWATKHPQIRRLFLFGSAITSKPNPSDIDVAIEVFPEGGSVKATYMAIWPDLLGDKPSSGSIPFHFYGYDPEGQSDYDLAVRQEGKLAYERERNDA